MLSETLVLRLAAAAAVAVARDARGCCSGLLTATGWRLTAQLAVRGWLHSKLKSFGCRDHEELLELLGVALARDGTPRKLR